MGAPLKSVLVACRQCGKRNRGVEPKTRPHRCARCRGTLKIPSQDPYLEPAFSPLQAAAAR